jgi:hypothetical protein
MSFAYHSKSSTSEAASANHIHSAAIAVTAGDLIVVFTFWADNADSFTCTDTIGNSYSYGSAINYDGNIYAQVGYAISTGTNASNITTSTFVNTATTYKSQIVYVFTPDAGDTVSILNAQATGTGWGKALLTASVSDWTETDVVAIAGGTDYDNLVIGSMNIDDVAADGSENESSTGIYSAAWYRLFTGAGTTVHADAVIGPASDWACILVTFKSVAAAGGNVIKQIQSTFNMRRRKL